MAETKLRIRHRGRLEQMRIYLGKFLRMFVYQNDWKVFPMTIIVAALVSMVVRRDFFVTMEGTLKGAFALTFVAIWNGCFNSIQVICRERDVVKREHRSGMHITSYIASHMIYQAMMCLVQTGLTLWVFSRMKVAFPLSGTVTPLFMVEVFVSVFLVTYAADMMSLFISSLARSTTAAMTVMPFVLIFQLIFSGGIFTLPGWANRLSDFSISSYGLKVIATQGDYNEKPMATVWNSVEKLKDRELVSIADKPITLGTVLEVAGEEKVKDFVQTATASAAQKPEYERTEKNIRGYWLSLVAFIALFSVLSTVSLEFVDKDKR